jgi:DNA-directed RNA polymerase specialized sigma subunit
MDVKFLTAEEEKELVIKAHAGDIAARNAVISNIDPFIWKMASKLANGDPEKAEIYHAEAVTVLCKKFHKYDVSFGCKFITWASAWIYQAIKR